MSRYAENTTVSSEQSRIEIERLLKRYGAEGFGYGWDQNSARIAFQAQGRRVEFRLHLPDPKDRKFTHTEARGQARSPAAAEDAYEQAVRQRWRALALVIKAKLEAVAAGITEFETEFLAHIMLPGGQSVGSLALPAVAEAYRTGKMQPMLGRPGGV